MKSTLPLATVQIQNFKAITDTEIIEFTPLTALIGNNGSGKSSVIEALATFQMLVESGLETAMQPWKGFENIWNKARSATLNPSPNKAGVQFFSPPMSFSISGKTQHTFQAETVISLNERKQVLFVREHVVQSNVFKFSRDAAGRLTKSQNTKAELPIKKVSPERSFFPLVYDCGISQWQFLALQPGRMGDLVYRRRTGGRVRLAADGSNLADYLREFSELDTNGYNAFVEAMQVILPFARDLRPVEVDSSWEKKIMLEMKEARFSVPAWLLSTGTLRIASLLAVLRHPEPPPLIIVEEIENGLDPRTIHLLVEEMRNVVQSGRSQIILTTHSPFLLDLLDLSQIVVVERGESGTPSFERPGNNRALAEWREKFTPGKLYTMGRLTHD
jgi:predicted ATPase